MQRGFINASSRIFVKSDHGTDAGQVCTAARWRSFLKEKQRTDAQEFGNITTGIFGKTDLCDHRFHNDLCL